MKRRRNMYATILREKEPEKKEKKDFLFPAIADKDSNSEVARVMLSQQITYEIGRDMKIMSRELARSIMEDMFNE